MYFYFLSAGYDYDVTYDRSRTELELEPNKAGLRTEHENFLEEPCQIEHTYI